MERTKKHQLIDIILIAILDVLCGAGGWGDIASFGKSKEPWLKTFLDLPNGIPSHNTFGRVFAHLDPKQFESCFLTWVQSDLPPKPDVFTDREENENEIE